MLGVWGKYHCVCIVVIGLRCMLDLLWDYLVPYTSNLLSVLLRLSLYLELVARHWGTGPVVKLSRDSFSKSWHWLIFHLVSGALGLGIISTPDPD